jgi:hypothetical protein
MKMKTYILTLVLLLIAGSAMAQANTPVAMAPSQPLLMTILLLAAAVGCIVFCVQVFTVVRGGQLSRSWLVFAGGFLLLASSQVLVLLTGFGVIVNNTWVVPGLLAAMTGLFLWGLYETKRVLG